MSFVADRLRSARVVLGLKQAELATKSGCSPSTYQKYEQGSSIPGGDAIEGFVRLGINANWLLTGVGAMMLTDTAAPVAGMATPATLDTARLRLAVETVEEGLSAARATMQPSKKADLLLAVYDLLDSSGSNKAQVLQLVKLAT